MTDQNSESISVVRIVDIDIFGNRTFSGIVDIKARIFHKLRSVAVFVVVVCVIDDPDDQADVYGAAEV